MTTENPAPEAETGNTSISDLLDKRHQPALDHEAHQEVGERPKEPDAVPPMSAQPAPMAETTPAAALAPAAPAAAPNFDELAKDPAFQEWLNPRMPKWAREGIKKANERAQEALRSPQPAPQPAPPRPAPQLQLPNPAEDPQGYVDAVMQITEARQQQRELVQTLRYSERDAKREHGAEAFEDCRAWLSTRPDLEGHFLKQEDPWAEALAYYNREKMVEEIGQDPTAYRKRIEEEAIARYQAQQQEQRAPQPPPTMRAAPPLPASSARSAAPSRDDQGRFAGQQPLSSLTKNKFR